jgi:hypothetical protein
LTCKERERLEVIYRGAVVAIDIAGKNIVDLKSKEWREATRKARQDAKIILVNLNRHRKEHGC